MSLCKYCGATYDADAVFCSKCGKPITNKLDSPAAPSPSGRQRELSGVDGTERPYLPGDPITPEMEARVAALRERVAQYTVSLSVIRELFRTHPDHFGEEEWKIAENLLAEKYNLSDISIFRQKELPCFEKE